MGDFSLSQRNLLRDLMVVFILCAALPSVRQAGGADEPTIEQLIEQMARTGRGFDAQPLANKGIVGMNAVLDHVFPETTAAEGTGRAEIEKLIEQLGDASFQRREDATAALRQRGRAYFDLVRQATENDDPEVRFRAKQIIDEWSAPLNQRDHFERTSTTYGALQVYLEKVEDLASQQELAHRVSVALAVRLDATPKKVPLTICLAGMARWHVDLVHAELLPLLEHDDPEVPMFAIEAISGRTGNSYVAPIHMGALASGKPELVKCALRSMPCPVWDRKNWPIIREAYVNVFAEQDPQWDFRDDDDFMYLSAFVAARDFRIEKARNFLLARMASDDRQKALRAIRSLGDTYYRRQPIYPELLAALEPHLKSDDAAFREAAIYTVGVYHGEPVRKLLIAAFADPQKQVWQTAGRQLCDQHRFQPSDESPIPALLRESLGETDDDAFKSRATFLLNFIENSPSGYLQWPE